MAKILISGGTGMVGRQLVPMLIQAGHEVHNLSRSGKAPEGATGFHWDYQTGTIDRQAFDGVTHIIHLAGASVADGRWTTARKKIMVDSRLKTGSLLVKTCKEIGLKPKQFISASGIAYYGYEPGPQVYTEEDGNGPGFLGDLSDKWEGVLAPLEEEGIDVTRLRIGVVLGKEGGALPKLALPVKWGVGSRMGNGKQVMSWIHLNDLCRLIVFCLENQTSGTFNAVAPGYCTQQEFTQSLASVLKRPLWAPPIPAFFLRAVARDMASEMLLGGIAVSSEKIRNRGFTFQFPMLKPALENLMTSTR